MERDPRWSIAVSIRDADVVVEGHAARVTDPDMVAHVAKAWADGGWPAEPDETGTGITAPYKRTVPRATAMARLPASSPDRRPWRWARSQAASAASRSETAASRAASASDDYQPMEPGTTLRWDWEMYGASSEVIVDAVEQNRRIAFAWSGYDPDTPTHVEFRFDARLDGTYIEITETGFSGDADTLVGRVTASTQGFTFLLSSMKAYLEHDLLLHLTEDAHPDRRVA